MLPLATAIVPRYTNLVH